MNNFYQTERVAPFINGVNLDATAILPISQAGLAGIPLARIKKSPHEGERHLTRHSTGKTYDFCAKLVPKRPQLLVVEFECVLGEAG